MKTANYYPQESRIDFIGEDNIPICGIMGVDSHAKASNLITQGETLVFTIEDINVIQKPNKSNKNA
jgi:hypothetical protein